MSHCTETGFKVESLGVTTRKYIPDLIFYVSSKRERQWERRKEWKQGDWRKERVPCPPAHHRTGGAGCCPVPHLISTAILQGLRSGCPHFCRWGSWGTGKWKDSSSVTQPVAGSADSITVCLHTLHHTKGDQGFPLQGNCWFYWIPELALS